MLTVYRELVEQLAARVQPDDILAFRLSGADQLRAEELTERNKAGLLTAEESRELAEMLEFDELLSLLKARALHNQRLPQRS